ncbi:HD domain-containing protein [Pseudomonas amygdali]|uniref:HD domain-containing protein n=1 Tax=Pseudomonas amygdali pv. lachrymans str. M301315 TaxID=629260 RepID=A0AAD0PWV2_PSEAV|nr:hypothetical protein [Pseudomonas amygdali]AXH60196.1 hypothetical protein PLA107_033970 [Pseudomonas amygdali pv. lachrymans str. M301315]
MISTLYSEPHRHYHSASHIERCLAIFNGLRGYSACPYKVELSLWLHDSVYNTHSHDNEHKSALLAAELLSSAKLTALSADVTELIMATTHNSEPLAGDAALMVGVDLAILGSNPEAYRSYSAGVRREYSWLSEEAFRLGRIKLLKSFLNRVRIFEQPACFDLWERSARANIAGEIESLAR